MSDMQRAEAGDCDSSDHWKVQQVRDYIKRHAMTISDLSGLGLETSDDSRALMREWPLKYTAEDWRCVLRDVDRLITALSEAQDRAQVTAIAHRMDIEAREATARKEERARAATIIDDRAAIEEGLASRNCGTSAEWRHRHAKEVLEEISAAIRSQS